MQYRTLGRTGIRVSEIGMGCEGFDGKSREQIREMVDVMEAACGAGGTGLSSRGTSAPSGRTASTSAPGTWPR